MIVQLRFAEGSDVKIYYDDYNQDGSITRTLAMRFTNGGAFEADLQGGRRLMIEETCN